MNIDKWAERVYAETDFGRSVATSVAGIIGLVVYLMFSDWVIAAFSSIITFPVIRLVATGLHKSATRRSKGRLAREEAERVYDQLSEDEKTSSWASSTGRPCPDVGTDEQHANAQRERRIANPARGTVDLDDRGRYARNLCS